MGQFGKGDHDEHEFTAKHMNDGYIITEKSDIVHGSMGEEIPGEEGQGGDEQDEIIGKCGDETNVSRYDPPQQKKDGDREKDQGHPVGQPIRHG